MKPILAAALLFALLLSLSGCGRGEPTASTNPAPPDTTAPEPIPLSELFPPFEQPGNLLLEGGGSVRVSLLSAESGRSYRIRYPSGSEANVGWDKIAPLVPTVPDLPAPSGAELLAFLERELGDPLPAFVIFVDLSRLTVSVVDGGEVLAVFPCSAGDAGHPTPRGRYTVDYKTEYLGKEGFYLCRWGVHYFGGYLLHSVLYTWRGDEILDGELSARISHGCVRLSPEASRWLYDVAPIGATVLVN